MNESKTLHKALLSIRKLKQMLQEEKNKSEMPIAIVGIGCRFPTVNHKNAYWDFLLHGKNTVTPLPESRWQLLQGTHEISERDRNHFYYGSYLENITDFDAYFFGISPREAMRMDPQQRILLEVAHEAILDAHLSTKLLAGTNTGVFFSLYGSQYAQLQQLEQEMDALFLPTGNASSIAANRLSYFYDLRGPSLVLDTACSSSLMALHLACLNLQTNACEMALVGAININLLPTIHSVLSKAKMLSPTGQCKTFDAHADGYVPGEGAGVIVLKPLHKALQDQNQIYAVIAGSAVNQDGKTNGLTAPNGLQQEKLLKSAYQNAKIKPENISYVECHGTGTFLGDPIEIQALGAIVGKNRDATQPCWIGSVKTTLGHLEPAAGMASIIKVALSLQQGKIPRHLNFSTPNPHIAFDKYHFQIPQTTLEWPRYGEYRAAGVSGFGFGGSNAHIVLRELSDEEKLNYSPKTQTIDHSWQHKRYWSVANRHVTNAPLGSYPLRGHYLDSPTDTKHIQFLFDTKNLPEIQDTFHVLHVGYYLEMLAFAAREIYQIEQFTVDDFQFMSPLLVPHDNVVTVQLILQGDDFRFYSKSNDKSKWVQHAEGQLKLNVSPSTKIFSAKLRTEENTQAISKEIFYDRIETMGMPAGETIRWTTKGWRKKQEMLCEFREPRLSENSENFTLKLHPGIVDACVQPVFLLLPDSISHPYVAMSIKKIKFFGRKSSRMYHLTQLKAIQMAGEKVFSDSFLFDEKNDLVISFEDVCMAQLNNSMNIQKITQMQSKCDFKVFETLSEQKRVVIEYLQEQFSSIFSMPKEDLDSHTPLQHFGMDSLLALAVMRVIETGLDTPYSMQEMMQDITIEKIANDVMGVHEKNKVADESQWIAYRQKQIAPKMKLFCFPYGGAGASIFREWQKNFSNTVEVCPIQLPGRENRLDEMPRKDIYLLVDELVTALLPEFNVPFAFFGHSFGSLVAFELARTLRKRGLPQPSHLFISAFPDPRLPSSSLDKLLAQLKLIDIELDHLNHAGSVEQLTETQLKNISDIFNENGVVEYRDNMMSKEIMKILLPIFVGDMSIVKSFHYQEEAPLDLPITVFLGKQDTWVLEEDHEGWSSHSQQQFAIHAFESGHLFIKDKHFGKQVAEKIASAIL